VPLLGDTHRKPVTYIIAVLLLIVPNMTGFCPVLSAKWALALYLTVLTMLENFQVK
jgi:hypothetical protein